MCINIYHISVALNSSLILLWHAGSLIEGYDVHNRQPKSTKRLDQIRARDNARVLADQRRHQEYKIKKNNIIRCPEPVEMTGLTWQALLLLLIVCPAVVAETRVLEFVPGLKIHNQPVAILPASERCQRKTDGISTGKICDVAGTTYFMKKLPDIKTRHTTATASSTPQMISYEEFNRQLLKAAGATVPKTQFFKEVDSHGAEHFYIGSEKVEKLYFYHLWSTPGAELGVKGLARYAVACTFIADLHVHNYGYNDDGLVLIDVDSMDRIPGTVKEYLDRAANESYRVPMLSLYNIRQMMTIYEDLLKAGAPAFHDDFHLTDDNYAELLRIYIKACKQTMETIRSKHPRLGSSQPDMLINNEWSQQLNKARNMYAQQSSNRHDVKSIRLPKLR